jgi:hypothetical protein
MRSLQFLILVGVVCASASASTLQHLSLKDMALQSTDIVRGHVQRGKTVWHGSQLFTHYTVFVSDRWKGNGSQMMDLALAGGVLDGRRQTWAGTPDLVEGREYVLFLWHSPSGLNLIIGLSQGLFAVDTANSDALQTSTSEPMVDGSGAAMTADPVRMSLAEMRRYVRQTIMEGR